MPSPNPNPKPKKPQSFFWGRAPVGWWLKGKRDKVMAHIWEGQDGWWRGTIIGENAEAVYPSFRDVNECKQHFLEIVSKGQA